MSARKIIASARLPVIAGVVLTGLGLGLAPTVWRDVQRQRYGLTPAQHDLFVLGLYVLVPLGAVIIVATVWTITAHIVQQTLTDKGREEPAKTSAPTVISRSSRSS